MTAAVRGCLLKSIHWEELVAAIHAVLTGDERIVLGVSRDGQRDIQPGPAPGKLSARECEVLDLAAQALSNGQIATRLNLTEATVKRHLRNVFVKLGAVSRLDAANKARQGSEITTRGGAEARTVLLLALISPCKRYPAVYDCASVAS